ncbi:hypothetical protein T492DRAFT_838679 [Pavlovales sp. CCMP2436]|nr:hypothetical protein T492DRAFT_838679 [Pavlovales sp. CCMP2436]
MSMRLSGAHVEVDLPTPLVATALRLEFGSADAAGAAASSSMDLGGADDGGGGVSMAVAAAKAAQSAAATAAAAAALAAGALVPASAKPLPTAVVAAAAAAAAAAAVAAAGGSGASAAAGGAAAAAAAAAAAVAAAGGAERLLCPRCSRAVSDRHGICRHCGDNAYQCRQCRNINFDQLDAFLCNEARPSREAEPVATPEDRIAALATVERELSASAEKRAQLAAARAPLAALVARVRASPAVVVGLAALGGESAHVGGAAAAAAAGAAAGAASAAVAAARLRAAGTGGLDELDAMLAGGEVVDVSMLRAQRLQLTGGAAAAAGLGGSAAFRRSMELLGVAGSAGGSGSSAGGSSLAGASSGAPRVSPAIGALASLYGTEMAAAFESLAASADVVRATRLELLRHARRAAGSRGVLEYEAIASSAVLATTAAAAANGGGDWEGSESAGCYACSSGFAQSRSPLLAKQLVEAGTHSKLLSSGAHGVGRPHATAATRLLCALAAKDADACSTISGALLGRARRCLEHEEVGALDAALAADAAALAAVLGGARANWPTPLIALRSALNSDAAATAAAVGAGEGARGAAVGGGAPGDGLEGRAERGRPRRCAFAENPAGEVSRWAEAAQPTAAEKSAVRVGLRWLAAARRRQSASARSGGSGGAPSAGGLVDALGGGAGGGWLRVLLLAPGVVPVEAAATAGAVGWRESVTPVPRRAVTQLRASRVSGSGLEDRQQQSANPV